MIIYRLTDRIPIEIGEIKVWVSPLTYEQKTRLRSFDRLVAGVEVSDSDKIAYNSIKFAVKEIEGLKEHDGSDYKLEFGADGSLTDACVSEILQLDQSDPIAAACFLLVREIKEHEIKGVKIDLKGVKSVKKKEA